MVEFTFNEMFDQHIFGYYKYDTVECIPGIEDDFIVDEPKEVRMARKKINIESFKNQLSKSNPLISRMKGNSNAGNWQGGEIRLPFIS